MATDTSQSRVLAPMAIVLPLDALVIDPSQGRIFLGPTATDFSIDGLATNTSQGHVCPGSTASDSSLDEPTTRDFRRWKDSWNEKMLLVRLKREGRDWEHIIKVFWKMDKKTKGYSAWTSMWQRAAHDIDVLGRAAGADREGEVDRLGDLMAYHSIVDAAWIDYEGIWDRISELMDAYGTEFKWTPERVEYAWTHGVSDIFPDIVLRQRQFSHAFLPDLDPY